jgi:hypothetical protein
VTATFLSLYAQWALLLSCASLAGLAAWAVARARPGLLRPSTLVGLQLALLAAALLVPALPRPERPAFRFEAPVKIWAASSARAFRADEGPAPALSLAGSTSRGRASPWGAALALLFAGVLALWLKRVARLRRFARAAVPIRSLGRVQVLVSDEAAGPLSFRLPGLAAVVLPAWILERPADLRLAVRHELQHHRAGDTLAAHVFDGLCVLFFWNPLLRLWAGTVQEFQELACDEALLGRRGISKQSYGRCLFEVAQRSLERTRCLVGTPGVVGFVSRGHLIRRLAHMNSNLGIRPFRKWAGAGVIALGVAVLGFGGFASQALVRDARVTMSEANAMAARAMQGSEFPIVVNQAVLAELNRYLGTPDGRDFFRAAVGRMEALRPMLERKAREYDMPPELLAMPIVESGYRNLPSSANRVTGAAGLWQFIEQTARNYGLRVNVSIDERLDMVKETDAAFRYLRDSQERFDDWLLSILSFNAGPNRVAEGIERLRSRDAFRLAEEGFEYDNGYLPKVMAAILILKNPSVLD